MIEPLRDTSARIDAADDRLIEVAGLEVAFPTEDGIVAAVRGIDFAIAPGEVLGVVGESGSGKSVSALSIMRLLPKQTRIRGSIFFEGRDLFALNRREMRMLRGSDISMIFQDPMTALNPVFTVGDQIVEVIRAHAPVGRPLARRRAIELLELVGIPEPQRRAAQYPHEFSGGMRQRAMIAIAVANRPRLIIADEPTTALDVTIQAQVMEVIADVRRTVGSALMLITHDLGLVAGIADRIMVMYAGRVFESGSTDEIFYRSANPYTRGLVRSLPRVDARRRDRLHTIPGRPPSGLAEISGCPFAPRCDMRVERCVESPPLVDVGAGHVSRCHRAVELVETG